MIKDENPELTPEQWALLQRVIERERGYMALGKMGRWLAAVVTLITIIVTAAIAANTWVISYIKKAAG